MTTSVTIVDVAQRCGYSTATVSRAFASPDSVSEKAKEKIFKAATELHYAPNAIARAMARRRTENIAFILDEKQAPAMLNPFYSPILESAMQEGTRRNYSLFITTSQDIYQSSGNNRLRKQMDGVIIAGQTTVESVEAFRSQNIPVVLLNNQLNIADKNSLICVTIDHFGGSVAATEHLYQKGHRKIGILAGRFSKYVYKERLDGYCHVLCEHNLPIESKYVVDVDPTLEASEAAMAKLLEEADCPSAFYCTNDMIAVGAMKAALHAGLRIPQDIAIVGFDDSYISRIAEPELTTVHVDTAAIGKIAAQALFDLIDQKPVAETHIKIPVELVVHKST